MNYKLTGYFNDEADIALCQCFYANEFGDTFVKIFDTNERRLSNYSLEQFNIKDYNENEIFTVTYDDPKNKLRIENLFFIVKILDFKDFASLSDLVSIDIIRRINSKMDDEELIFYFYEEIIDIIIQYKLFHLIKILENNTEDYVKFSIVRNYIIKVYLNLRKIRINDIIDRRTKIYSTIERSGVTYAYVRKRNFGPLQNRFNNKRPHDLVNKFGFEVKKIVKIYTRFNDQKGVLKNNNQIFYGARHAFKPKIVQVLHTSESQNNYVIS